MNVTPSVEPAVIKNKRKVLELRKKEIERGEGLVEDLVEVFRWGFSLPGVRIKIRIHDKQRAFYKKVESSGPRHARLGPGATERAEITYPTFHNRAGPAEKAGGRGEQLRWDVVPIRTRHCGTLDRGCEHDLQAFFQPGL